jgi:hypothetical protein
MRRPLLLGAAWIVSAGAAVGLGYLAVSLVDASASPGASPAGASTSAPPTTSPAGTTSPEPSPVKAQHVTVAGTVLADCTSGVPVLAGVPALGWWVDDSPDPGQVEFESDTQKLEVEVSCGPDGAPVFSDEGLRGDDDGGRSTSSSHPSSAPAGATSSSGGHGSDDSVGDDGGGGGESDDDSSGSGSGDGSDDDSSGRGSGGDDRDREVESGDDSGGHGSDD